MIPAPVARLLHTLAGLAPDGATARVPVAALAEATGLQVRRVQQLTRQAQALGFLDIDTQAGRTVEVRYGYLLNDIEAASRAAELAS